MVCLVAAALAPAGTVEKPVSRSVPMSVAQGHEYGLTDGERAPEGQA
jgi:hypothetical protein